MAGSSVPSEGGASHVPDNADSDIDQPPGPSAGTCWHEVTACAFTSPVTKKKVGVREVGAKLLNYAMNGG